MAGMISCWIAGTALLLILGIANCPFEVTAGVTSGMLAASLACWEWSQRRDRRRARQARQAAARERLARRSPWTERDRAILNGDLSMGAWRQAGQVRQGGPR